VNVGTTKAGATQRCLRPCADLNVRARLLSKNSTNHVAFAATYVASIGVSNLRQLQSADETDSAGPVALVREFGLGEVDFGSGEVGTEQQAANWLSNCLRQLAEGIPANGWRIGRVQVKQLPNACPGLLHDVDLLRKTETVPARKDEA
jgi:hypothetical protein